MAKQKRKRSGGASLEMRGCTLPIAGFLLLVGIAFVNQGASSTRATPTARATVTQAVADAASTRTIAPSATTTQTDAPTQTAAIAATATDAPAATESATSAALDWTPEPGAVALLEGTVYTLSQANVRECPMTSCEVVTTFGAGVGLPHDALVNGEPVEAGNWVWYRVQYAGRDLYVYSSVVTTRAPQPASAGGGGVFATSTPLASSGGATCPRYDAKCTELSTCEQAMACLAQGNESLDRDRDGIPCESLCAGG